MSTQDIERKIKLLRELQRMAEEAQAEADALKDEIKAYMGDSEELRVGEYKITWKPVESSRLDTAALKKALPELAAQFTKSTTSRRFCIA
jgi:predicted phage-related endonuclease